MTTYSVNCGWCGREMLFEQPEPMADPGELSAFCSNQCSRSFGEKMFSELPGVLLDMPCGCLVLVSSVHGSGSTMPWPICEKARGKEAYFNHSNELHKQAVELVRRQIEEQDDESTSTDR